MKIVETLVQQLQRESLSHIEPEAQRLPSDEFVAVIRCDETRRLYRAWKRAKLNHLANIQKCKEDVLAGQKPRFDLKKLLLNEAKVDILSKMLQISIYADYPEILLELQHDMVLCQGWELVLRKQDAPANQPDDCGDPTCPVHGVMAQEISNTQIIGVMKKGEC